MPLVTACARRLLASNGRTAAFAVASFGQNEGLCPDPRPPGNCPPLGVSCTLRMQEVCGNQGPCQRGTAWPAPALQGSQFASWMQPAFVSHEMPLAALLGASFLPFPLQSLWAPSPHGLHFPESPRAALWGNLWGTQL